MLLSLKGAFPSAILALADGTVFVGNSIGAQGTTVGEVVFNTAITGYQEKRLASAVTGADDEANALGGLCGKPGTVAFSHQGPAGVGVPLRCAREAVQTG